MNMDGGDIFGNTATGNGGGIYVASGGTLNITNGAISGNSTQGLGGGIYSYNGTLKIDNVTITNNTGEGIYHRGGMITFNTGTIGNNTNHGVSLYAGGLTINDGLISGNGGSGVYVPDGGFIMNGGVISGNKSYQIDVGQYGWAELNGGTIIGNIKLENHYRMYISKDFFLKGNIEIDGNTRNNGIIIIDYDGTMPSFGIVLSSSVSAGTIITFKGSDVEPDLSKIDISGYDSANYNLATTKDSDGNWCVVLIDASPKTFPKTWKSEITSSTYMTKTVGVQDIHSIDFIKIAPNEFTKLGTLSTGIEVYGKNVGTSTTYFDIVFVSPNIVAPADMSNMFSSMYYLKSVKFTSFNSSQTTNMSGMFLDVQNIEEIDVSGLETDNVTNMDSMFVNCKYVTSLDFSNANLQKLTSAISMFLQCSSLQNVKINNLKKIYNSMFRETAITNFEIPETVTEIEQNGFKYCKNLVSLTIPAKVTATGETSFEGCTVLESVKFLGKTPNFGNNSFSSCSGLKMVDIADVDSWFNLKFYSPETNPLYYAKNLYRNGLPVTNIVVPETILSINTYAFINCTTLESVVVGSSVTSIGTSSFSGCASLKSFHVGSKVTSIGASAFYNCTSLKTASCDSLESWLKINFSSTYSSLTNYANDLVVDGKVLTDLIVPSGITSINSYAFTGCKSIKNISIPTTVTTIKPLSLKATSLDTVITPLFAISSSTNFISFFGCSAREITITTGNYLVTNLFKNCTTLEKLTLPTTINSIHTDVFSGCTSLKEITTPILGSNCSIFGSNVETLIFNNGTSIGTKYFSASTTIKKVVFPEGFTTIDYGAFMACKSIEEVVLPTTFTTFGLMQDSIIGDTFEDCTNLKKINLGECLGVKVIPMDAFSGCTLLSDIEIPSGVETINNYAFQNCSSLKHLTISNSITKLGDGAFAGTGIRDVVFEDGTGTIEMGIDMFNKCANLALVVFSGRITSLPQSTFYGCSSMKTITIPSTITEFGIKVFRKCTNLKSVYIEGVYMILPQQFFSECSSLQNFSIYSGCAYIGEGAFEGCTNYTNCTIPSSVYVIAKNAFNGAGLGNLSFAGIGTTSGWKLKNDSGNEFKVKALSVTATDLNSTYADYAWTRNNNIIQVTFSAGTGASYGISTVPATAIIDIGSAFNVSPVVTLGQYSVGGSMNKTYKFYRFEFPDGTLYSSTAICNYTDDITVTAKWTLTSSFLPDIIEGDNIKAEVKEKAETEYVVLPHDKKMFAIESENDKDKED